MTRPDHRPLGDPGIAALFDGMADEYDLIPDLWYSWLFCRMHYFLVKFMRDEQVKPGQRCLDVGCGTGFQSLLFNACGHDAVGIDIAAELVERAKLKRPEDVLKLDLFPARFSFARKYAHAIRRLADLNRTGAALGRSEFLVGSATAIDFPEDSFDIVNCCGSTLSFVSDYPTALREMARVLKPGGYFMLEIENRFNPDLLWTVLDSTVFRGKLGYDEEAKVAFTNLTRPRNQHVKIDYPFSSTTGEVYMPLWLFSASALREELSRAGLKILRTHGIHIVTNLIPSTLLDRPSPPRILQTAFSGLGLMETMLARAPFIRNLGCSSLLIGRKIA